MRKILILIAGLSVDSAAAAPLDCDALKKTSIPFEIAFDFTSNRPGQELVALPMRRQVRRAGAETFVYDIMSGNYTLNKLTRGLMTETYSSLTKTRRTASYSIKLSKDYLAAAQPFQFKVVVRNKDGTAFITWDSNYVFNGETDIDLGGCNFRLTKMVRTNKGRMDGKNGESRIEIWYSPELKVGLYSLIESQGGVINENTARGITTSFTPVAPAPQ